MLIPFVLDPLLRSVVDAPGIFFDIRLRCALQKVNEERGVDKDFCRGEVIPLGWEVVKEVQVFV